MIPVVVIAVVIALLLGGCVGALMVALGARARHLDDDAVVGQVLADLTALAVAATAPDQRGVTAKRAALICDRWLHSGRDFPAPEPVIPPAADYVHRIVDAYATGDRLDFRGCWVSPDIQGRLRAIMASAAEPTGPLPDVDRHPLTGLDTLPSDPAQLNTVLRARAATKAGG